MKLLALVVLSVLVTPAAAVESRPLTLQQAVDLALRQNRDLALARLEEQAARQAVREARSPFVPRVTVGSGLAYSSGFPLSIEGAAPSIVQAQAAQFLLNRPQSLRVREASVMAGSAEHATGAKADEVAYRVAALYLDFERATRAAAAAARHVETLERLERLVGERVSAGREIPLERTRARVETARARARSKELESHAALLEVTLRADLGLEAEVRLLPVETRLPAQAAPPDSEEAAVAAALASAKHLKQLESAVEAKRYSLGAERAQKWPRLDLVAQYALLGRFNNYEDFFRTFERHNGQVGLSVQIPVFARGQIEPRVARAETEISQASLRLEAGRSHVALEARRLYREATQTEAARELARMELDLARESLSVMLARLDEGRVRLSQVEEARLEESRRWEAYYDAQTASDKARLALLRQTGGLLAALR